MRLRRLELRNFGMYRGRQEIDFLPRTRGGKTRPIVLVGGQNGAGKTTILDAVRLCLYGKLALGARVADAEYNRYLRERIHRNPEMLIPVTYASVALEFDYAHGGVRSTYEVQRAWEAKGEAGVTEMIRVQRDGKNLEDVESAIWPEFIRSLVPLGVSQLFFFDGEKIKRLAEEDTQSTELADSIKALLGLDLVERLQDDLDLYVSRFVKKTATGSRATRLAEIDGSIRSLTEDKNRIAGERESIEVRAKAVAAEIAQVEETLAQRGEGLSAQRTTLTRRKAELSGSRDAVQKELRALCEGALPMALCPSTTAALRRQLTSEARVETWNAARDEVGLALDEVARYLGGPVAKRLKLSVAVRDALKAEIAHKKTELTAPPSELEDVAILHGLAPRAAQAMLHLIQSSIPEAATSTHELVERLKSIDHQLHNVERTLKRAPDDDEIAPLIRQLSSLQEEAANLALQVSVRSEDEQQLTNTLATLRREREKLEALETKAGEAAGRLAMARNSRRVLDDYLQRLTTQKVEQLRESAAACFKVLCRKEDLVEDLRIDPLTFEVTLFGKGGVPVPKDSLSAGEKQIYAISLLWALSKISGRPLPLIVDTPLGRLDRAHRQFLVERYFPVAAHQVIVLSTDTEIDQTYFEQLKPFVSHSVHLRSNVGGWTEAAAGYFWEEKSGAVASA